MLPSPWERRSFLRGMRQGVAVAREMSSGNQVREGQWGATSRTCSSSSLSLHSLCASRLTGGNAYLRKARGQLCASASVPRGSSVREKYSWQWEDSGAANRSTWASPNRLQISRIVSGWSRHSPGNESCRESASAAPLSFPGMWTARIDLNCVGLQRRRWRASFDMWCDCIPPSRLIYKTAAVLTVRTSMCLPNTSGRNCHKAKCTAHSSRQLMCQSSRGHVQSPEADCPLHVTPQPVLEASVVTTVCRDTCSRGTPARRKARSVQGLRERRHCWVIPTRSVPRRHAHLGTRECSQCWSGLIWIPTSPGCLRQARFVDVLDDLGPGWDAGGAALLREARCAGQGIDSAWGGAALEDAGDRPRRRADWGLAPGAAVDGASRRGRCAGSPRSAAVPPRTAGQSPRQIVFKLGSVIFSIVLKEVSSAQQGCIYLYRKKYKPDSRRGVSKMAKTYYFTNLLMLG